MVEANTTEETQKSLTDYSRRVCTDGGVSVQEGSETPKMDADAAVRDLAASLDATAEQAEELTEEELEDVSDEALATLRQSLKNLEDVAEETRKNTAEEELDARCEIGEVVAGLERVESHSKYVQDAETAMAELWNAGMNPRQAMEVNASDAAKLAKSADLNPEEIGIGRYNYDYYRSK
jgi:histidinol dehydrogenase